MSKKKKPLLTYDEALVRVAELEVEVKETLEILTASWAESGRKDLRTEARRLRRTVSAYDQVANEDMPGFWRTYFAEMSIDRHNGYAELEREITRLRGLTIDTSNMEH